MSEPFKMTIKLTSKGLFVENILEWHKFAEVPPGKGCSFKVESKPTVIEIVNLIGTDEDDAEQAQS